MLRGRGTTVSTEAVAGNRPALRTGRTRVVLAAVVLGCVLSAVLVSAAGADTTVDYEGAGPNPGVNIRAQHFAGQPVRPADELRVDMAGPTTVRISAQGEGVVRRRVDGFGPDECVDSPAISPATSATQCELTGARNVHASLGDGADVLNFASSSVGPCLCLGGTGSDTINGTSTADRIEGGDGNDFLSGQAGNDTILGGAGDDFDHAHDTGGGADVFQGGFGIDTAWYFNPGTGVSVSLDGVANDGTAGEGDNIMADVENVIGGLLSSDVLLGNSAPNRLQGSGGNDTLRGANGNDTLDGGLGTDMLDGGDGNDLLLARDGVDDQTREKMSCGPGSGDEITADLKDDDTVPIPADCEKINQSDRREGPNVVVRSRSVSVNRKGQLSVRLACPRKLTKRCAGTLASRLDKRRTSFGRGTRYKIRPGRSATVKTKLRASQRRAARRRGARVRVRSVERGLHGPKTTVRSLRVRKR